MDHKLKMAITFAKPTNELRRPLADAPLAREVAGRMAALMRFMHHDQNSTDSLEIRERLHINQRELDFLQNLLRSLGLIDEGSSSLSDLGRVVAEMIDVAVDWDPSTQSMAEVPEQ